MTWTTRLITAALLVGAPAWASAWQAENYLRVNPVTDGVFEVVGRSGSGGVEYWCAAGDYARRVLNSSATQRIYIVRGQGPSITTDRKSAVQFSLTAPAGSYTDPELVLSVTRVGENLNAASARNYCLDRKNMEF